MKTKISRNILFDKYVTKKMTMQQIADELECVRSHVFQLLKKYNIPTRKRGEHTRWNKNLTKETDERVAKYAKKYKKTMEEKRANGELIPWNKDLTKETDERVRKNGEAYAKVHKDFSGENNPFHGKHHTDEFKSQQSIRKGGTGIPYENNEYGSEFNDTLKEQIRKHDNYTCQLCGLTQEKNIQLFNRALDVHHIDFDKKNNREENLVSLCIKCHTKTNADRVYWKKYFNNLIFII